MTQKAGAAPPKSTPSFALALGGGGARGLAHIHILETLDELGIRPVAIAGSSIGAIMGAAYAAGMTGREINDHARGAVSRPAEVAARVWQSRPGTLREAVRRGFKVSQFDIERIVKAFLPQQVPADFAALKIPLQVTATDFYGHRLHVMSDGDLVSALGASAALPAIFEPVRRDGALLVDGGLYNPVPFDLLRGKADIIIAVDVVGWPEPAGRKRPTSIDLMYGASQLMMQSIIANQLQCDRPHVLLRPSVSRYRVLDFLKMEAIMADTVSIREEMRRAVDKAVAARQKG